MAMKGITQVELINLPKLKPLHLMSELSNVKKVIIVNAGKAEEESNLKRVMEEQMKKEEKLRKEEEEQRMKEWRRREREMLRTTIQDFFGKKKKDVVYKRVGLIVIHDDCCNVKEMTRLDLGVFVNLREFRVGDRCFKYVREVSLCGMKHLMKVQVGASCFTTHRDWHRKDPNCAFYLKDCPLLKELKVGRYSFSDYVVCEIDAVPALERIEIGELEKTSFCFYDASLVLKGKGWECQ